MRLGRWAWVLLAATTLVAGCKNFWVNPDDSSGSGGCTTNCSTDTSGNFFILNNGTTPQVLEEIINSGKLASVGSAVSTGSTPWAMALGSSGKYLYVSTDLGVYLYPVTSSGLGSATPVDNTDTTAEAIAVDGNWLVEAIQGNGAVSFNAVPLNSSNGGGNGVIQTANFIASKNSPSVQPGEMAVSPDGNFIFVALGTGGLVYFPFHPNVTAGNNPFGASGSILPVANTTSSALSVAVDPGSNLVYVGETNVTATGGSGAIFAFLYTSLGSSTLTQATGSPIAAGGSAPNAILPIGSSGGASPVYIYVASGAGLSKTGSIVSFSITTATSGFSIATGSTIDAGTQPVSLAVDSTGVYLLAVSAAGGPYFDYYTFDATTAGQLDLQSKVDTGASPLQIVAQ